VVIAQGDVWWADLGVEHAGKLTRAKLELVLAGLDAVLGR
jgi:hypothetical protein